MRSKSNKNMVLQWRFRAPRSAAGAELFQTLVKIGQSSNQVDARRRRGSVFRCLLNCRERPAQHAQVDASRLHSVQSMGEAKTGGVGDREGRSESRRQILSESSLLSCTGRIQRRRDQRLGGYSRHEQRIPTCGIRGAEPGRGCGIGLGPEGWQGEELGHDSWSFPGLAGLSVAPFHSARSAHSNGRLESPARSNGLPSRHGTTQPEGGGQGTRGAGSVALGTDRRTETTAFGKRWLAIESAQERLNGFGQSRRFRGRTGQLRQGTLRLHGLGSAERQREGHILRSEGRGLARRRGSSIPVASSGLGEGRRAPRHEMLVLGA